MFAATTESWHSVLFGLLLVSGIFLWVSVTAICRGILKGVRASPPTAHNAPARLQAPGRSGRAWTAGDLIIGGILGVVISGGACWGILFFGQRGFHQVAIAGDAVKLSYLVSKREIALAAIRDVKLVQTAHSLTGPGRFRLLITTRDQQTYRSLPVDTDEGIAGLQRVADVYAQARSRLSTNRIPPGNRVRIEGDKIVD
ncbi:MAG: hypothetical protein FJ387_29940 [Verrucomicrobia bacterium]|nr:hypothetical protein [Verrucomicrobiota bacterium]